MNQHRGFDLATVYQSLAAAQGLSDCAAIVAANNANVVLV